MPAEGTFLGDFARAHGAGSEAHELGYLAAAVPLVGAVAGPWLRISWGMHQEMCHVWVMSVGRSALSHRTTIASGVRDGVRRMRTITDDKLRMGRPTRASDAGLAEMLDASEVETDEKGKLIELRVPIIPPGWMLELGELAPLLSAGGGTGGYREHLRELLLQVYDGILRSDTKQTKVPEQPVSVSILGNITEEDFEKVVGDFSMISSGFLGRWVPMLVPVSGKRCPEPSANGTRPAGYEAVERHLDALAMLVKTATPVDNVWARASPEARQLRRDWYAATHPDDRSWDGYDAAHRKPLSSLWGRWQGTQIKLAVIHALSREARQIDAFYELEVSAGDVAWSIAVVEQAWAMTRKALPEAADQTTIHGRAEELVVRALDRAGGQLPLRRLTERLKTSKGNPVTRRDVRQAVEALAALGEVVVGGPDDGDGGSMVALRRAS